MLNINKRWIILAVLVAVLAAELTLWPPAWWSWVSVMLGWVWAAFRALPNVVQFYAEVVIASVLVARWVIKHWFWHVVITAAAVVFFPLFDFGMKMTLLFYGLPVLLALRWFVWKPYRGLIADAVADETAISLEHDFALERRARVNGL